MAQSQDTSTEFLTSKGFVEENANRLYELMQQKMHCDVDIVIKNESYPVHKIIMVAASEYFRSQTWRKRNNSENPKVTLTNISSEALQWVIHFCYTGSLELKKTTVDDVVSAASYLQVDKLIDISLDFYLKHMSVNNCLRIATLAQLHHRRNAWNIAFEFCCKNFMEIIKTVGFLLSNYELILDLLKSEKINIFSEEDVFRSLKLWVNYDRTDRIRYFPSLLEYIKLELLNLQFLTTDVLTFCSTQANNCQERIVEIIRRHSSSEKKIISKKPKARPSTLRVLAVGGRGPTYASMIEIYNPLDDSWRNLFEIKNGQTLVEFGAVIVENELFAIGGYGNSNSDAVSKFQYKKL
ncbi:kelch-like protein 1 [Arctopsyche grandis]|uniref:kelch-like protein 1 n=1 Tax=Arctopsyche grandis TaxID=121162 RepID=UPI00406D7A29